MLRIQSFSLLVFICLLGAGCVPNPSADRRSEATILKHLVGPTGSKYWDLIYATDIAGNYQLVVSEDGQPNSCELFSVTRRLLHYGYLDTLRVLDQGCDTDIAFNPDRFVLKGDTLMWFADRKHIIQYLSEDLMILKHASWNNPRAFDVYQKSAIQNKVVVACKP